MNGWQPMSWPYIAGFFDGEGSLDCGEKTQSRRSSGRRNQFRLHIYQNDKAVLDEIAEFLNFESIESSVVVHQRDDRIAKGHGVSYMIRISGCKNVVKFLLAVEGHLRVKRDDALYVIEWGYTLMEAALSGEMPNLGGVRHYFGLQDVYAVEGRRLS